VACKVYAGNLPWLVGDEELRQLFEPFGEVISAEIVIDHRNRRPRGFGFLQMASDEGAQRAIAALNGMHWHGRPIKVAIAIENPPIDGTDSP
jgi:RNA recognition motif-containing protein